MAFSVLQEGDFFGRSADLSSLLSGISRAVDGKGRSVVLSGRPGVGKTELLRQLFGHLFWKQREIVPFLYTVSPASLSPAEFARDYLTRFLAHCFAFKNREQALLRPEGMSIEELAIQIEQRDAVWAQELLDRFRRSASEPQTAMAIAVNAPRHAALAAGVLSVVLIDDFHRLAGFPESAAGQSAVSAFEPVLSFGRTPHILSGNQAVIDEMPAASRLERVPLLPLGPSDIASLARFLQNTHGLGQDLLPAGLLDRIAGNPFYLSCILARAEQRSVARDEWRAYAAEIDHGAIARYWTTILKEFFPDLASRGPALRLAHRINRAPEALPAARLAAALALPDDIAQRLARRLHLAGFVRGEFGLFKRAEDRVLQDFIEHLYEREIVGSPAAELERRLLEQPDLPQDRGARFEMTLPMAHEVELIAAKCLEQIGTNLQLDGDAIGQLQIALIEACINAIEHSNGSDRNLYLAIAASSEQIEVSVESSGQEFVLEETREPSSKTPGRGWGIKLMKRFVDDVRFEKTRRGTKTILTKKLAGKANAKEKMRE